MNTRAIFAIVRKDLKVVSQNKGVVLPIIIVILVFFVVLPLLVSLVPSLVNMVGVSDNDVDKILSLINRLPMQNQQEFVEYTSDQKLIVYVLAYLLAPLFLIIPLMVSSVIAADSFAGEKERKTMEALLYTPTTDRELFIAKLLSGWLTAIAVALAGFAIYVVTANVAGWSQLHRIFFPNPMWLVMIFWVVPALPGLALGVMVMVSARAQGFQDANQLGGVVILPVLVLFYGQISGLLSLSVTMLALFGLGVWLLDVLLIWLSSRRFQRGKLMGA